MLTGLVTSGKTVNTFVLAMIPAGVVTLIVPVVAFVGTNAEISLGERLVKFAATPLNRTADTCVKFVPRIVTGVSRTPLVGEKLEMRGATKKRALLSAVPMGVVTLIIPEVAPGGTAHAI